MWGAAVVLFVLGFALPSHASAQDAFEAPDFDVKRALLDNGFDVSAIQALLRSSVGGAASACEVAVSSSVQPQDGNTTLKVCSSIQHVFGSKVLTQNTSTYDAFTNSYWSAQQASANPLCVFQPTAAQDVSILVLVARLTQCPFAVKSGGHAAFTGASSIHGGITVTFDNMKGVVLSKDRKIANVQPGNTWYDVYHTLEPENLAVIGGRVSAIGVGGLTLGGGISFYSNEYGWACDNVGSYEVVTASGAIVTASPTKHTDLYWALRGGGNNFGIVTGFNLETIPQGLMWGGARLHIEAQFAALIDAFYNLGLNADQDVAAAQILSFVYFQNTKLASSELQYAKPIANASILSDYLAIPAIQDGTMIRTLANLTLQLNTDSPTGLRETYWTATFKLDRNLASFATDIFFEEAIAIADTAAFVPALTLQVITVPMLRNFAKQGGNALGLSEKDGPLLLLQLGIMWANEADDERVLGTGKKIIDRSVAEGKERGLFVEYIYMNYASQFQEVVPSYGPENHGRLKAVAKKYDPQGVFQVLQPGYFKLDGAPSSEKEQVIARWDKPL